MLLVLALLALTLQLASTLTFTSRPLSVLRGGTEVDPVLHDFRASLAKIREDAVREFEKDFGRDEDDAPLPDIEGVTSEEEEESESEEDEESNEQEESGENGFLSRNVWLGERVRQSGVLGNDLYVKNGWVFGGILEKVDVEGLGGDDDFSEEEIEEEVVIKKSEKKRKESSKKDGVEKKKNSSKKARTNKGLV